MSTGTPKSFASEAAFGGVPSRYYADPEEARVAGEMARQVLELVERKLARSQESEL
jgi:hypothetical protein